MHFLRVMCQVQCNPLHLRWINGLLSAFAHIFVISHWDGGLMMFCWNGDGLFGWFYCYNRHQEHKIGLWRVRGWIVSSLLRTGVVPKTKQSCMTDGGSADLRWPFLIWWCRVKKYEFLIFFVKDTLMYKCGIYLAPYLFYFIVKVIKIAHISNPSCDIYPWKFAKFALTYHLLRGLWLLNPHIKN